VSVIWVGVMVLSVDVCWLCFSSVCLLSMVFGFILVRVWLFMFIDRMLLSSRYSFLLCLFWCVSMLLGVIGRCLVMVWVIFIVWLKEVRMILVFFCWVYCFMVWMLLLMCIILFVVVGN